MIKMTEVNNGVKMHDYSIIIIIVHWPGVDQTSFHHFTETRQIF